MNSCTWITDPSQCRRYPVFESTVCCLFSDDQETMAFLRDDTYTVDEAVDAMGFGPFQFKLLAICGLFTVSLLLKYSQAIRNDCYLCYGQNSRV